jgi:hypothetical protein
MSELFSVSTSPPPLSVSPQGSQVTSLRLLLESARSVLRELKTDNKQRIALEKAKFSKAYETVKEELKMQSEDGESKALIEQRDLLRTVSFFAL